MISTTLLVPQLVPNLLQFDINGLLSKHNAVNSTIVLQLVRILLQHDINGLLSKHDGVNSTIVPGSCMPCRAS